MPSSHSLPPQIERKGYTIHFNFSLVDLISLFYGAAWASKWIPFMIRFPLMHAQFPGLFTGRI